MSLLWLIIGTVVQFGSSSLLLMGAVFGLGGLAQGYTLSKRDDKVLTSAIFVLPAAAVISSIIVVVGYWHDSSASIYWWYGLPWVLAAFYIAYIRLFVTGKK